MNTRLKYIQNWEELAREAKWSASGLARICGVSLRTLQRHFLKEFGKRPKTWLSDEQQLEAVELLRAGSTVKETAACVGYKHPTNLTRKLKNAGLIPVVPKNSLAEQVQMANVAK